MSHIIFDKQRFELNEGQTVLSVLLDRGYEIPNSCRAGVCQGCLMQAVEGEVPESAQVGLKDTLKSQGYFMACSCQPDTPLKVVAGKAEELRCSANVVEHKHISDNILRLRLKPEPGFNYRGGQYITTWKNDTLGRSYSLASVSALDDHLELHIRRIPDGRVSNWLHDEIKLGDTLQIQSAMGDCFYVAGQPEQEIMLAGTGTGLAPLIGIARDALHQGHRGDIHLIHGTTQISDLYMHQTLLDMAEQYPQFHYHANVLNAANEPLSVKPAAVKTNSISSQPLDQQLIETVTDLAASKIYLCGDAGIVNALKRKLFIAGASINNIYSDPFISAAND